MKALTKKVSKTETGGGRHSNQKQNVMEEDNIDDVLAKAKDKRRQNLFGQRVTLLKAEDALKQLGGEDNYESSLLAIVTAYPNGITLTRVRQLLPDSGALDAAKDSLKNQRLIEVGTDKRSPLLKPMAATTKPDGGAAGTPTPTTPEKPAPKPVNAGEDKTEE